MGMEELMIERGRFAIFFERHIGFGLRWDHLMYPFELSVSIPFLTVSIGFGEYDYQGYTSSHDHEELWNE